MNLTRKQFLLGAAAFSAALVVRPSLAAEQAGDYTAAKIDWKQFAGQEVNVLFSRHPWQEALEPLVPEFEKLTGLKVNLRKLPEKQYLTKVPADLTAGTFAFDVFMTQVYEAPKYAKDKWVQELTPYMKDPALTDAAWYDWNDFFPGAQSVATMGNTPFANLAVTAESQVLVYRKDVLDKLGITPPKTFEELLAAAKTISEKGGGINGITLRGGPALWWPLYGLVSSYGGDYLDKDLQVAIDKPESVAGVSAYVQLAKYAPQGITNFDWDEINTAMLGGQAAMFLDSSVVYSRLIDPKISKITDKVGVVPFPTGPAGAHGNSHYWTISMASAAKNPKPAWLFMQWATSRPMQGQLALAGVLGPRASAWKDPALKANFGAEFIDAVQSSLSQAVIARANVSFLELADVLRKAVQQAMLGDKEVQPAMTEVASQWRQIMKG